MAYFDCIVGGSGKGNTLVVTCADDLAGATITCTNGTKTYTKTCPSTSPYEVTFYGLVAGTWTVSATVSGNTYTTTVVVVDCAALLGGFSWRTWVDTASQLDSSDYDSLSEVLADEEAVRELCLEHACVDYMADIATANEDVETIINNDLFAKWVNNSDYSLDVLGANVVIKALMDEADKYFYGEWCLMPQVPTMTSNTAPYGTVIRSTTHSTDTEAWKVFDNNSSSYWQPTTGQTNNFVGYRFVSPVKISRIKVSFIIAGDVPTRLFKIQGSNDNFVADIHDLSSFEVNSSNTTYDVQFLGETYSDLRLFCADTLHISNTWVYRMVELQFYAWQPKGNVPIMTSNTTPYGEVIAKSTLSGKNAYSAFDDNVSTEWRSNNETSSYIGYKFTNPICVKAVSYIQHYSDTTPRINTFKIQGSNDGTNWTDLTDTITAERDSTQPYKKYYADVDADEYYLYVRMSITATITSGVTELQFYGRELSVSVPIMTSNTTPYGVASASSIYATGYEAFRAFDKSDSSFWIASMGLDNHVRYDFKSETIVNKVTVTFRFGKPSSYSGTTPSRTFQIQAYDGSDWTTVGTLANRANFTDNTYESKAVDIDATSCQAIRLYCYDSLSATSQWTIGIAEFQVFGKDYSEKEFEAGTTKKWLYDHGVELEEAKSYITGNSTVTKYPDCIREYSVTSTQARIYFEYSINGFSILRAKTGKEEVLYNSIGNKLAVLYETSGGSGSRYAEAELNGYPYNHSLGVSALTAGWPCVFGNGNDRVTTLAEMWLE